MISVIIPVHNERSNLAKLLPRLEVLSQLQCVEIIVSISADNTDPYDFGFNRELIDLMYCKHSSRAKQMNLGAQLAKGDILVFLHADVWPPDGFFRDIKDLLNKDHQAGFFSYQFDEAGFFLNINAFFTRKDGIFTGGGDQCLFIKKETFDSLKGFDENQVIMEDFEFFNRMKKAGVSYAIIKNDLMVSARKYENNSYLRVNLTNLLLVVLFKLGWTSHTLKRIHGKCLKLNYRKELN